MSQIQRTPLADQATELLMNRIRAGEWGLGAKLPGEMTLALQLGVGRSTVREAIRQLAGRGVLSSRQGAGVFVTALEVPESWRTVVSRADIISVIDARLAIETASASLAAEKRSEADIAAIKAALEYRKLESKIIDNYVDADMAFHRAIIVATKNPILLDLFDGLTARLREAMVAMLKIVGNSGSEEDHDIHARLFTAIEKRDVETAASLSRSHLQSLKDWLI